MKNMTLLKALSAASLLVGALACGDDTTDGSGGGGGNDPTTTTTTTGTGNTTTTTGQGGEGAGTTGGGGEGGVALVFAFADAEPGEYVQVDRHGAVEAGTAGIETEKGLGLNGEDLSLRDEYNAASPQDDADGDYLPEIAANVTLLHDLLDDDLTALGLDPATVDQTVDQAGPVIIPDTIKYDPSQPTGYPNGRNLTDPVVDITLAAVLLDLSNPEQPLTSFVGVLNPEENDLPFKEEFPYLADPHAE